MRLFYEGGAVSALRDTFEPNCAACRQGMSLLRELPKVMPKDQLTFCPKHWLRLQATREIARRAIEEYRRETDAGTVRFIEVDSLTGAVTLVP